MDTSIKSIKNHEIRSLFHGQPLSYLVGFYIFAFYLELHFRIPELQAIRFQFTYGALVGALCIFKIFHENKRQTSLNSVTKTAILLIFICGIYTIFSMDRSESIKVFIDRVLKFALVSFFIYAATKRVEDLRVILAFMLLAWLKIGQEGFTGWLTGNLVWENQGIPRLHGSTEMYGHPNSFSGFAVGCLPYTIFFLMCIKSNLLRIGLCTLLLFSLIIIVTTGSRTGYLATLIGAIYFFMQLKAGKVKVLILAIISLIVVINIVPIEYKERFSSIFTGEEKEGSSSDSRIEIIKDALSLYAKYPLGVGVQAFPKVRYELFGRAQNTHNLYLEVLTNIGPLGLIVFLIFVYRIIKLNVLTIKFLESRPPNMDTKFLINVCKGTIGYILMRIILGIFGMDLYEIYWWIALGISLAVVKISHIENETTEINK